MKNSFEGGANHESFQKKLQPWLLRKIEIDDFYITSSNEKDWDKHRKMKGDWVDQGKQVLREVLPARLADTFMAILSEKKAAEENAELHSGFASADTAEAGDNAIYMMLSDLVYSPNFTTDPENCVKKYIDKFDPPTKEW